MSELEGKEDIKDYLPKPFENPVKGLGNFLKLTNFLAEDAHKDIREVRDKVNDTRRNWEK